MIALRNSEKITKILESIPSSPWVKKLKTSIQTRAAPDVTRPALRFQLSFSAMMTGRMKAQ